MNTIEKTTEEIKNTIIKNKIKYLNHHKCGLCGIYTRYIFKYNSFDNFKIWYDSSCDCTIYDSHPRNVTLKELTSFINDNRILNRIIAIRFNEELGFEEIYFNDLALKQLDYPKISQKELEKTVTEYVKNNKESLDFSKNVIIIDNIPFEHTAVKEDGSAFCKGTHIGVKLYNKYNSKIRYVQYIESFYTTKKEE